MLTYHLRFYTGPARVRELGEKFEKAGVQVEVVGTEHLIVLARGDDRYLAALSVWHKLHDRYATTFGLAEPRVLRETGAVEAMDTKKLFDVNSDLGMKPGMLTMLYGPTTPAKPMWQHIDEAARDLLLSLRQYGDGAEADRALERLRYLVRVVVSERVRVYVHKDGDYAVFFDGEPGSDLWDMPGSMALVQYAGYVERVHPDGTAQVVKDRYTFKVELPMSTEPLWKCTCGTVTGAHWPGGAGQERCPRTPSKYPDRG